MFKLTSDRTVSLPSKNIHHNILMDKFSQYHTKQIKDKSLIAI